MWYNRPGQIFLVEGVLPTRQYPDLFITNVKFNKCQSSL